MVYPINVKELSFFPTVKIALEIIARILKDTIKRLITVRRLLIASVGSRLEQVLY